MARQSDDQSSNLWPLFPCCSMCIIALINDVVMMMMMMSVTINFEHWEFNLYSKVKFKTYFHNIKRLRKFLCPLNPYSPLILSLPGARFETYHVSILEKLATEIHVNWLKLLCFSTWWINEAFWSCSLLVLWNTFRVSWSTAYETNTAAAVTNSHRLEKTCLQPIFQKHFFQYLYLHPGIATNFWCWKGKSWTFTLNEKDDILHGDRQEEC